MKILFMGDYSNLHAVLAGELRRKGHHVTVVSDGGRYMQTETDILHDRQPGLSGTVRYMCSTFSMLPRLRGYDIVQLINPHFMSLKPSRLKGVLRWLCRHNGRIFLTLAGDDYVFVDAAINKGIFRFSEFMAGGFPTDFEMRSRRGFGWLGPGMCEYNDFVLSRISGALSVLPEYDMAWRPLLGNRLCFANLPVDLARIPFRGVAADGPLRFFIGMRAGMEIQKGTQVLYDTVGRIVKDMPGKCTVEVARNLSLSEYLRRMSASDVVLDQLYSYSPGTNGLQAMAFGKISGTGAQPEYYEYLDIPDDSRHRPLLALSPLDTDLEGTLRSLVTADRRSLQQRGEEGRRIIERHHTAPQVAARFESFWMNCPD